MKKLLALALVLSLALATLAGCSKDSGSSTPGTADGNGAAGSTGTDAVNLVNDDSVKEFRIACFAAGDVNPPMNEWWIWEEYEKKTGIKIIWEEIPSTAVDEKKNLLMASDNKPDAFWQIGFSVEDLIRYGTDGSFVDLKPYMSTYAPNVSKLLTETVEDGMASVTMPDGGIYSLPWVMTDLPQMNLRYWLNKNWLEAASLPVPTSIDELTKTFAAFKEQDVNKNGDPNDEWPIYYQPGGIGMFEQQLAGSYGVGNNGLKPLGESYYIDANDKVQYLYTSEGMKEIWKQMAEWWKAGYFHPETFGTLEYEKWVTDGSVNDIVGMYGWVGSNYLYANAYEDYTAISVFQGPDGSKPVQSWCDYPIRGVSSFTITSACKAPGTLLQWADYFYGEEGVEFGAFGTEGVTFERNANGDPVYIDKILDYEGGPQLGAYQYGLLVYGGGLPCWYVDSKPMEIARKQDSPDYKGEKFSSFVADSEKYVPDLLPGLIPTLEEAAEIPTITTDVNTYIKEARAKFVTGEWNFDKDWENYVSQLEKMNIGRYVEIKQAQYDRLKEAQA